MPPEANPSAPAAAGIGRDQERLLRTLAAATFLIFFQAFMIAPLIPDLAGALGSTADRIGLAVPAYLLPYGAMTLVWGPVSDRVGRAAVILCSAAAFAVLTAATAAASGPVAFIAFRTATAVGASGVVPMSLALVGDVFPYQRRGHALGWLFGAMAGGMAFGSSTGALLAPLIGWRGLFLAVAGCAVIVLGTLVSRRSLLRGPVQPRLPIRVVVRGYLRLLEVPRARRTYSYVLVNAIVQSGVYTWLGVYLSQRFGLTAVGIGLALLLYGVPGFVFGPTIGRIADRRGRARLIPLGLAVTAAAVTALALPVPLVAAAVAVGALSLGYDLTQPMLAGIVTDLPTPRGQAMSMNVCILFIGFGAGSLLFQALSAASLTVALSVFATGAAVAAVAGVPLFENEKPNPL